MRYAGRVHSQVESLYHTAAKGNSISRHRLKQQGIQSGLIHSDNSRHTYLRCWHQLADFALRVFEIKNLYDLEPKMISAWLEYEISRGLSYDSIQVAVAAIGKLEKALILYCSRNRHHRTFDFSVRFGVGRKAEFRKRDPWGGYGRAYERPLELIQAIENPLHQLIARIQLEGGLRAEGVGHARDSRSKISLALNNLKGTQKDPLFGNEVGVIDQVEKGGKESRHYVSESLYLELDNYLKLHGPIRCDYQSYRRSINSAAMRTGQFVSGRGTHGLKHSFVSNFISDAIREGKSQNEVFAECSRRCSHRRLSIVPKFYAGR
ncbi:MAG: hypothetical protein PHP01_08070 [Phycisphaerae bacterium]|nr:hypothetical protein [Phycisphaerae bacterium]